MWTCTWSYQGLTDNLRYYQYLLVISGLPDLRQNYPDLFRGVEAKGDSALFTIVGGEKDTRALERLVDPSVPGTPPLFQGGDDIPNRWLAWRGHRRAHDPAYGVVAWRGEDGGRWRLVDEAPRRLG